MSFSAYPDYKNSAVAWLGAVPSHWEVAALKRQVRLVTQRADQRIFPVALENIESWTGRFLATGTEFEGDGVAFEPGDILYGKLRPYLAKILVPNSAGEAIGDFHVLRPLEQNPLYLSYLLRTKELVSVVDGSTYGSKMPRASWAFLGSLVACFPPRNEQIAIATFLDRETAKIDALVAEQERLIALLREKRQGVISHAVTRGLNPDTPMKDSGIEWLGEIPVHWEIRRLKSLSPSITVGIVVNPSDYVSEEGLPFLYGGDIAEGAIFWANARKIRPEVSLTQAKTMLEAGDLVTVRVGAPGITAVVPEECAGGNCASVMLIRKGVWPPDWLCYAMNARTTRYQVELVQYGAAQKQFNINHAIDFIIPTPPQVEANEIAYHLAKIAEEIDKLQSEAQSAITLLQERRAALISAAVTGKIDVRALVDTPAELELA